MRVHRSFAFLMHSLLRTDKDGDTHPIPPDSPPGAVTMGRLRSWVNPAETTLSLSGHGSAAGCWSQPQGAGARS